MTGNEKHIGYLFAAELQFRLASAVRLATTLNVQPLDLPTQWTHGKHNVTYDEVALRQDQADYAAHYLHRAATFLMAVAMKDAIRATVNDPRTSTNPDVRAAYQIARMIRNAFAHAPLTPRWSIDKDHRDQVFEVPDIITLDTKDLDGTPFDWRHYGGPLALFRLSRFVRIEILKDQPSAHKPVPVAGRMSFASWPFTRCQESTSSSKCTPRGPWTTTALEREAMSAILGKLPRTAPPSGSFQP
jgi:hypothetical protein